MSGTKENITFNAFSIFSEGPIPDGYGGFNWNSVYEMGNVVTSYYCGTGFNTALRGSAEAFTSPFSDGYGLFESSDLGEHFTLKIMIAATAWAGQEGFTFNSYSYNHGQLKLKASDYIQTYQTGGKIDFANYGKDFKNIVAVDILTGNVFNGHPGSYCTYGGPTYGYQMAFDNLKVVWHGPIPNHRGQHKFVPLPIMQQAHAHHGIAAAAPAAHGASHGDHQSGIHGAGPPAHAHCGYHSELLSLHDAHAALASQFALPAVEHFGV